MSSCYALSLLAAYSDSEDEFDICADDYKSTTSSERTDSAYSPAEGTGSSTSDGLSPRVIEDLPESPSSTSDDELERLLPPLTTTPYPAEAQRRIDNLLKQVEAGFDLNEFIQSKKEYRNPSLLEKLIQHCDIDEFGTNLSPQVYDPLRWESVSFYDELAKQQQSYMAELSAKRKRKEIPVEIISGRSKKSKETEEPKLPNAHVENSSLKNGASLPAANRCDPKVKLSIK